MRVPFADSIVRAGFVVRSLLRVLLCRFHRADFYCLESIMRIPLCGFYRADSIVQIPSCKYHPIVRIPSCRFHRARFIVRTPSCKFHCIGRIHSIMCISSCVSYRAHSIVCIPSCAFHCMHSTVYILLCDRRRREEVKEDGGWVQGRIVFIFAFAVEVGINWECIK